MAVSCCESMTQLVWVVWDWVLLGCLVANFVDKLVLNKVGQHAC